MVFAIALLAFGALVAIGNWALIVRWKLRRKSASLVPLFGSGGLIAGALLLGWPWGALLALADPGTLMIPLAVAYLIRDALHARRC